MAKGFSRARRVGEQIQRDLAQIIQKELRDPRLGMITISAVDVSKDLAYAKVFVSLMNAKVERNEALEILEDSKGLLRHELAQGLRLRSVPELRFAYDDSMERGARMSALIDKARSGDSE